MHLPNASAQQKPHKYLQTVHTKRKSTYLNCCSIAAARILQSHSCCKECTHARSIEQKEPQYNFSRRRRRAIQKPLSLKSTALYYIVMTFDIGVIWSNGSAREIGGVARPTPAIKGRKKQCANTNKCCECLNV
jgi:hypothetical protein